MSWLRIVGIAFLALLALLALLPAPFSKGKLATFGVTHDFIHAAVFCFAFYLIAAGSATARRSANSALILLAFGAALELLQARRYGIWLEYRDIFADAAGTLLGCLSRTAWISSLSFIGLKSPRS